jgi:general secretion pathway protein D
VVEPSSFETREVGVLLTVLPDVSPEGQMITLTMMPQVVDPPTWKNYGSLYTAPDGTTQQLTMEQPFFHTRTLQTTVALYNGATVVMGGMITENRTEVDDKIPLLGDIPIIGRLFRSRYETSEKHNLLIFVTARLVDPAGEPIKPDRTIIDQLLQEERSRQNMATPAGGASGGTMPMP